jgi:hypothetical protein
MSRALHLASILSLLLLAQCAKGSGVTRGGSGNAGPGGAGGTGNTGGTGGVGNEGNTGGAGNSGNTGNTGGAGNAGNTGGAGNEGNVGNSGQGGAGNSGNSGQGGAGNSGNSGQGGAGNSGNSGQGGAGNAPNCNPLNPGGVCTPAEHCFPMPNGVPVCQGPVGPGANYSACTTAADCQAAYECIDTGDVFLSPCCLEWCISAADCPGGSTCEYLSTPVYVGAIEYGVCYDGLGGC